MSKSDLHHASTGFSFPFLDGLRGFAILSVVIFHLPHPSTRTLLGKILTGYMFSGYMGVSIFFVISGFLITLAVFDLRTKKDFFRYLLRRAGKILPPFYLTLILFAVMYYFRGHGLGQIFHAIVSYVTTYTNFDSKYLWYDPPCWTLFIEMHFYLLLPLIYVPLRKITSHAALFTWFIFLTIPALVRFGSHYPMDQDAAIWFPAYNVFPRTFDSFSFGILFALLFKEYQGNETIKKLALPLANGGLLVLIVSYTLAAYIRNKNDALATSNYLTLADLEFARYLTGSAGCLLLFLVFANRGLLMSLFTFAPLRYIGIISYEWYLVHYPIIIFFNRYRSLDGNVWIGLLSRGMSISLSLSLAVVMYHFFSAPILNSVKSYAKTVR